MDAEGEIRQLEAKVAALEAKGSGAAEEEINTDGLMQLSQFEVGVPPIVPIGGGSKPFEWDQKDKRILGGTVLVGRQALHLDASNGQMGDHDWAVKVTFTSSGATLEYWQWDGHEEHSDEVTYLPLYRVRDGNVEVDWRDSFYVQCWE